MKLKSFPFYKQPDAKDCGPTCLRIIARHYGKAIPLQEIRNLSETTREGSSLLGLSDAAENLGFRTMGVQVDFKTLVEEVPSYDLMNLSIKPFCFSSNSEILFQVSKID
ncbi:hypothetical protein EIZ46_04440 [Chryseobacterium lacus]|nr:hypothetical protein EIZ46_04440 [Chryseobacterium lacus]